MGKKNYWKKYYIKLWKNFFINYNLPYFFPIQAEIIKIIINGNSCLDETIQIYGEIEINKDIQERDLDKIFKNLYSTNFFEDVNKFYK